MARVSQPPGRLIGSLVACLGLLMGSPGHAQESADDVSAESAVAPMGIPIAPPVVMPLPVTPTLSTPPSLSRPPKLHGHFGLHGKRLAVGATTGAFSAAPAMIGDSFGDAFQSGMGVANRATVAGDDRRFKMAENVSPIPRDRVFLNYHHFSNALVDTGGRRRSLDRLTLGLEKTFLGGAVSIETRLPVSHGPNSRRTDPVIDPTATEVGNLAVALKALLLTGPNWLISGGVASAFPTRDDDEFIDTTTNTRALLVQNEAVHVAPFLGFLVRSSDRCFTQGFLQMDFDLNGNDVFSEFAFEGTLQDQNLFFLDVSFGRWFYVSPDPRQPLSGIVALAELHYTSTMNDTDKVYVVTNPDNRMDILNASAALHFQLHQAAVRVGAAAPLRDGVERLFDAEFILQFDRRF